MAWEYILVKDYLITIKVLTLLVYRMRFSADMIISTLDSRNFTWKLGAPVSLRSLSISPGEDSLFSNGWRRFLNPTSGLRSKVNLLP